MSISVQDLTAQELDRPAEDRAKLVEHLIASFEPRSPSEAAWLTLAARRRDAVRAGKVAMAPVDEAITRIRARIA